MLGTVAHLGCCDSDGLFRGTRGGICIQACGDTEEVDGVSSSLGTVTKGLLRSAGGVGSFLGLWPVLSCDVWTSWWGVEGGQVGRLKGELPLIRYDEDGWTLDADECGSCSWESVDACPEYGYILVCLSWPEVDR